MSESIYDIVNSAVKDANGRGDIEFATVQMVRDGKPVLIFPGEAAPSMKEYKFSKSYEPAAGDRVMLIKGIIICGYN